LPAITLVGIKTIKQLLKRPGFLSLFTVEAIVTPELFKIKDIVIGNLLDQYFKEECVKFDSVTIAEDIFKCTLGHKGLIGTCC